MSRVRYLNEEDPTLADITSLLRDNMPTIQRSLDRLATSLLVEKTVQAAQVITAATFVDVLGLGGSFQASGDLLLVLASLSLNSSTNNSFSAKLSLDGTNILDEATVSPGSASWTQSLVLFGVRSSLLSGNHSVKIQAKVSGGTVTINFVNRSKLLVIKF